MNLRLTATDRIKKTQIISGLVSFIIVFILLTIIQDFFEARFSNTAFYFYESFLFTSFWWIFIPLFYVQFSMTFAKKTNKIHLTLIIVVPVVVHLFAFPALVWVISGLSYEHTFRYWQTFKFGLAEHLYKLVLFYSVPYLVYRYWRKRDANTEQARVNANETNLEFLYETTLWVAEGNKRTAIEVGDILYFTASSPYIHVHHKDKKYLHNESLKSMSEKLDSKEFVRIHKSTIVNISKVQSYMSRLNGDYDLTLQDRTQLRLSRNYAMVFKARFRECHRVTSK